jgi:hypothetical protein
MPIQFEMLPMALLWPLMAGLVIYAVLRWVLWEPGAGSSPASASRHALWVGVMGWMASSLQGAGNAGIIPVSTGAASLQDPADILPALAWPILGCLGIHAIGQLSYYGPRRARRPSTLPARRVKDFFPAALARTTLGIFAASVGTIAWASTQPPYNPLPYTSQPDAGGGFTTVGGDGRIAGTVLAACLAGTLLVLAAGTALLLWLISRRRDLEELDAGDNNVLRTIAMNRLLRTVAAMAAGLAAIAGNFACRPDPSSTTAWTNAAGLGAVAVLLAMWWWPPPRLPSLQRVPRTRRRDHSAAGRPAALSESLGAAIGMAAVLPALASLFLLGPALPAYGAAAVPAIMAVCVLLAILGGELLLQRNYGRKDAVRGWPRRPVAPALLTATVVASALLAGVIAVTAFGEAALDRPPSWIPTAAATAAVVLAVLPAAFAVRRRHGISTTVRGMDAALRAITAYRIVRTLAAFLAAEAGGLLITASYAWAPLLEPHATPSQNWMPAVVAGAVLVAAGAVISVIPVRRLTSNPAPSAPPVPAEPVR